MPSLAWNAVPPGWSQSTQPSAMRLATFNILGEEGQSAELAIIPMAGFAGTEGQLVNMWRAQIGLGELAEGSAEREGTPVTIGELEGRSYEMACEAQSVATRIIVASVTRDDVNYFFKLIGNDELVSAQKGVFLEFLKGIEFGGAEPAPAAPAAAAEGGANPWTVPADWQERPATQFLMAKYQLPEGSEVTVSKLGGDAGGLLPNVNRWRGQMNLAPVDEAGLGDLLSEIKAGQIQGTLVTLNGTDLKSGVAARMLVAVVSVPGETWFFKLTGPITEVEARTAEFREFVNALRLQP